MSGNFALRLKRFWVLGVIGLLAALLSGCQTLSYYKQAIQGQYKILRARRPIQEVLANPQTSPELKERLEYVLELRRFAAENLKLPVDRNYQDYADLKRRYVVWNIYAAPEFSLTPKTWCYPLVGRLEYRGYFSEPPARRYGAQLAQKGYDIYVSGIVAYSTLGWFKDPILNTFVFDPKLDLADTLFHELAHRRVFAGGDTEFDEAFATMVGEEGVRRWLLAHKNPEAWEKYQAEEQHDHQFVELIMAARNKLAALYARDKNATPGKRAKEDEEMERRQKAEIIEQLRTDYKALRAQWGGDTAYDKWFAGPINNAKLNTVAAYYEWVPAFRRLLQLDGGDMEKFYKDVQRLSKLSETKRHRRIQELLEASRKP